MEAELVRVSGEELDVRIDEKRLGRNSHCKQSASQHMPVICSAHYAVLACSDDRLRRAGARAIVALVGEAVWGLSYGQAGDGRVVDGLD